MKRIIVIYFLLAPLASLSAQSELSIVIDGLESNKGVVIVNLLDTNEESVMDKTCNIINNQCKLVFKDVTNGSYAVQYFHDENENKKLDKNIIGIPKEGFGFSNDAMGKFGPKDFSEWLFEVSGDIKIKMKIN